MLSWLDLCHLLGPHLPGGTYGEVVYFLPLAFDSVLQDEQSAAELTTALVGFVSLFASELQADGALEEARRQLKELLHHWSREFIIIHKTQAEARAAGSGAPYLDFVRNSGILFGALEDFIRFGRHKDIVVEFVLSLARHDGNPIRAAWFLEFARYQWRRCDPIEEPQLTDLVLDAGLLSRAGDAFATAPQLLNVSPTYLRDLFHYLDLLPRST